jgi:putative endonuclease
MRRTPPNAHQLGNEGETLAHDYVQQLGWEIVARNWHPADRSLRGELDLVALDRDELVFCEVKTRSGTGAGQPIEAVTSDKLRQLRRLAAAWLAEASGGYPLVRFDVIGVHWRTGGVGPTIEHHRDVG